MEQAKAAQARAKSYEEDYADSMLKLLKNYGAREAEVAQVDEQEQAVEERKD